MTQAPAVAGRTIGVGSRRYPLLLPKLRDPRLHLASVIFSLQILGQTVLGFELSIAQILVSLGTCAVLEVGITFWQRRIVMWPASAMLTGNGVAFILRVPGTEHGDWWSLRGAPIFISVAALSLLSKYVIRIGDRHLFNPSNIGLVACFLILGSKYADPQDLWWGPISPGIVAALVVIAIGGVAITFRQGLFGVAASFFATFAVGTGTLAAGGHCVVARWDAAPVCGSSYWWVLMSSPEILVFCFFMITDPRTIPDGRVARVAHGLGVGAVATLLVAPQTTEFATKVAILGALVVVCGARPLLDRWAPAMATRRLALAAGAVVLLGATIGLGAAAREIELPASAEIAAAAPRPEVEVPAGSVPDVTIGGSAKRTQPPLSQDTADRMGHDLVAALIEAGGSDGPSYEFDTMVVELLRDPDKPQDPPRLGITGTGTVSTGGGAATAFKRSFALVDAGGYFVITAELER